MISERLGKGSCKKQNKKKVSRLPQRLVVGFYEMTQKSSYSESCSVGFEKIFVN